MFKHSGLTYLLYPTIDIGLTLLALRLARFLREIIPLGVYLDEPLQFSPNLYFIVPIIWLAVFVALEIYNPARTLRSAWYGSLPVVWMALSGAVLIFAGVAYLLFRELSRLLFFYFFILDILFLSVWRWLLPRYRTLNRWLSHTYQRRVVIVGTGPLAQELAGAILKQPASHLMLVGLIADDIETNGSEQTATACPLLGNIQELPALVQQHHLQDIIFAVPPEKQANLRSLSITLQAIPINLRLVPDIFDLVFLRASVEDFGGIPIITLREPAIHDIERLIKRLFDLTVSGALLLLLSPLMLVIAWLIKVDSPGSILFRQQRVGEGGRLFWMYKFRSMIEEASQQEPQLLQETTEGLLVLIKTVHDERITRVGHFLRQSSLDELPQLFNVLKGDMSLVGPRPELPRIVDRYEPWQRKRFAVPQGMTGWWQVNGRMNRATPQQRSEDDLFYIRNYSLWLDLRILWKTIWSIICREGAY